MAFGFVEKTDGEADARDETSEPDQQKDPGALPRQPGTDRRDLSAMGTPERGEDDHRNNDS